jgi:hypothetical protein
MDDENDHMFFSAYNSKEDKVRHLIQGKPVHQKRSFSVRSMTIRFDILDIIRRTHKKSVSGTLETLIDKKLTKEIFNLLRNDFYCVSKNIPESIGIEAKCIIKQIEIENLTKEKLTLTITNFTA